MYDNGKFTVRVCVYVRSCQNVKVYHVHKGQRQVCRNASTNNSIMIVGIRAKMLKHIPAQNKVDLKKRRRPQKLG